MTLVQVVADEKSVHMACDFRLTDQRTGQKITNTAHKLVTAQTVHGPALIGVTGIAFLDGKPVGDWIAEATGGLGITSSVEELLDALREAEDELFRLPNNIDRSHTFMIATFVGSQALVALVSNFERFVDGRIRRASSAETAMTISSIKPKSAVFFATGDTRYIKAADHQQLTVALRADASDNQIHEELRRLNEVVSDRAKRAGTNTVSVGCYAASLHATGQGTSRPFLTGEQPGDFIPPEFALMMKRFGIKFNRRIGPDGKPMPIQVVQSASGRSGASPEYFREQLKLQPENAEVWNNYGSYLTGRGRYEDVISAFEKAHELDPSYVTAAANLAKTVWKQRGDVRRAKELYEEAVIAAEPSVPSWILTDFAIFSDEALSDYVQAADLHDRASRDKDYPLAWAQQALFMLERKEDPSKASALLASALEKQPGNPQILAVAARADFFYLGNPETACQKLHKACSLNSNDVYLLRLAADLCAMTGDSYSAAYYYRKVIKRQPYDAEVHGNYGLALLMERKLEGAQRHLKKAARASPDHFGIRTNLAATLWAAGNKAEAVALMCNIIDAGPPPEIELEVMAMSYLTTPSSRQESAPRIRQLIAGGAQADGTTVRRMARDMSRDDRETGEKLARAIEGKDSFPPDW